MSHELRTPLNSILVLGQQLSENHEGNLTPSKSSFSRTIHGAGTDLLNLNQRHSRFVENRVRHGFRSSRRSILREFARNDRRPFRMRRKIAGSRLIQFADPALSQSLVTDAKRLQPGAQESPSNAFKFTEQGQVRLSVFEKRREAGLRTIPS